MKPRRLDSLTLADFRKCPAWRFTNADTPDEFYVVPVRKFPADCLHGCIVAVPVGLANGTELLGILGNLDLRDQRSTEHFLTFSVFRPDGAQFHLARYFDSDAAECGSAALAKFLSLPLKAVFPIAYDLSGIAIGPAHGLPRHNPR